MLKQSIMVIALAMGTSAFAQEATPQPPADAPQAMPVAPAQPEAAPPAAVPANAEESAASQKLAASGYTDVQGLVKQGNDWRGTAMHGGKRVQVTLAQDGSTRHKPLS